MIEVAASFLLEVLVGVGGAGGGVDPSVGVSARADDPVNVGQSGGGDHHCGMVEWVPSPEPVQAFGDAGAGAAQGDREAGIDAALELGGETTPHVAGCRRKALAQHQTVRIVLDVSTTDILPAATRARASAKG